MKENKNYWDKKRREYPLNYDEAFLKQPEPMFDFIKLQQAYEYFYKHRKKVYSDSDFINYIIHLEKDIPLEQQKYQP